MLVVGEEEHAGLVVGAVDKRVDETGRLQSPNLNVVLRVLVIARAVGFNERESRQGAILQVS